MNNIVNWEYYSSLHNVVSENDFSKAEALAEKEVALVIGFPRWEDVDDTAFYFTQLKDCICNVIDKMASTKASGVGKGVASVSNDGYSESYVVQTESQARAELSVCIADWLSMTGLVGGYPL